jgi:molecular chaperone DnaJ
MSKDLYSILEVDRNATEDEIKKSYRKLAMKYHPDKNNGDNSAEAKFKEISSAYETLSDPQKKSNYDRFGTADGRGGNPFGGGDGFGDIFSQFGDIFGGNPFGRQQKRQAKGSDLRIKVTLNIDEILKGGNKKIKYKRSVSCESCSGSGGTDVRECIPCNGSGQRTVVQNTPFGQIRQQVTCPDCQGGGKQIKNKCGACHGEGTTLKEETVDIQIPAGVSNGMQLSMPGYGSHIRNGVPGDLYIVVEEMHDASYRRENNNIIVEKTISIIEAICGEHIKVKTPHGEIPIYIEPGTEHGKSIRVGGKGIPDIQHGLGDLYVKISIKIPKKIDLDEKFLLEKLKSSKNFTV